MVFNETVYRAQNGIFSTLFGQYSSPFPLEAQIQHPFFISRGSI